MQSAHVLVSEWNDVVDVVLDAGFHGQPRGLLVDRLYDLLVCPWRNSLATSGLIASRSSADGGRIRTGVLSVLLSQCFFIGFSIRLPACEFLVSMERFIGFAFGVHFVAMRSVISRLLGKAIGSVRVVIGLSPSRTFLRMCSLPRCRACAQFLATCSSPSRFFHEQFGVMFGAPRQVIAALSSLKFFWSHLLVRLSDGLTLLLWRASAELSVLSCSIRFALRHYLTTLTTKGNGVRIFARHLCSRFQARFQTLQPAVNQYLAGAFSLHGRDDFADALVARGGQNLVVEDGQTVCLNHEISITQAIGFVNTMKVA